MQDGQVHAEAAAILDFWFALTTEQQFGKDDDFDRNVAARFGALRDRLLATGADGWRDDPRTLLAAIVALDQFSRNIHRGTPQAFAADPLAVDLTREAIARDWEGGYTPAERVFLYMPLMHSEDLATQDLSVAKFTELGIKENLDFARDHHDVIAKYGRFPSRNAALGRVSTEAEEAYLADPDAGW